MRLIGLVILLVGLVLVASVTFALYGLPLLVIGAATLAVARYQQKMSRIKRQEAARIAPPPEEWQPTARRKRATQRPSRPAARPTQRSEPPAPHRERAAPARRRQSEPRQDREPTLATGRFEPLYDGEESGVLFHDMRAEISAQAKRSLAALGRAGYIIRAKTDRVTISRDNRTEVLRSNAAIVDFAKQLGLMGD